MNKDIDSFNCGIYKIINKLNNKFYLGSSRDINSRIKQHKYKLKNKKHHSKALQNAWNKYDEGNFYFKLVESCEEGNLLVLERYYLDNYYGDYNCSRIASGGNSPLSKEDVENIIDLFLTGRYNCTSLGEFLSISNRVVYDICRGRTYNFYNISESKLEKCKHLLQLSKRGKSNPLSPYEVSSILWILDNLDVTYKSIANYFDISRGMVSHIRKGRVYKGVTDRVERHDLVDILGETRPRRAIEISRWSICGDYIDDWPSVNSACVEVLGDKNFKKQVRMCCDGLLSDFGGFVWKYNKV